MQDADKTLVADKDRIYKKLMQQIKAAMRIENFCQRQPQQGETKVLSTQISQYISHIKHPFQYFYCQFFPVVIPIRFGFQKILHLVKTQVTA